MNQFNYDAYMKNNPLLKETDGYGNYKIPVLEDKEDFERVDAETFDIWDQGTESDPIGGPLDNIEDRSKVGPDEENLEEIDSESESNFAEEFGKSLDSVRETTMYAHIAAKETGDQPWINALDRITSILDQLESYVDDRDRKLGVIRKREVNK